MFRVPAWRSAIPSLPLPGMQQPLQEMTLDQRVAEMARDIAASGPSRELAGRPRAGSLPARVLPPRVEGRASAARPDEAAGATTGGASPPTNFYRVMQDEIRKLEDSLREVVSHTSALSRLRSQIDPFLALGINRLVTMAGAQATGLVTSNAQSLIGMAEEGAFESARRILHGLPRHASKADWQALKARTIDTPPFKAHEASLSPALRNLVDRTKNYLVLLLGDSDLAAARRDHDDGLSSLKGLFERYALLMNLPTRRKTIDFEEQVPEPDPADLSERAMAVRRLELGGLTRFEAMSRLMEKFPSVPLRSVFMPHLLRGRLPAHAQAGLQEHGFGSVRLPDQRPPLLLLRGEGGTGKSTVITAVAAVLDLPVVKFQRKHASVDALMGRDRDVLLERPYHEVETYWGHLLPALCKLDHADVIINLDNIDTDLLLGRRTASEMHTGLLPDPLADLFDGVLPPGKKKSGRRAEEPSAPAHGPDGTSDIQDLFNPELNELVFASAGGLPVDTRGWIILASTNQARPKLKPGTKAHADFEATMSRVKEADLYTSADGKEQRLTTILNDSNLPRDHALRQLPARIAERDAHHKGSRAAMYAMNAAMCDAAFSAATGTMEQSASRIDETLDRELGGPSPAASVERPAGSAPSSPTPSIPPPSIPGDPASPRPATPSSGVPPTRKKGLPGFLRRFRGNQA